MKRLLLSLAAICLLFSATFAQITSVGIIGPATPGGWDSDTDMVQDTANADLWSLTITLLDGEAKFRADDDWTVNWGETTFPFGTGTQGGPNIPVIGGDYTITFNSGTGEYFFDYDGPVGIIGDATAFGWDRDINMFPDTAMMADSNKFFITMDLGVGEAKFRLDDDWAVNWGATDFPEGVGEQDGPNIPISKAGNYTISFDTASGAYSFVENVTFSTVGIIGSATAGGWDTATAMIQDGADPNLWTLSTELSEGGLQFSANDGEIIWGADGFPTDTATVDGDTLAVPAGRWLIEFSTETGIYTFTQIQIFGSVGIIGDATPGGWDTDTDLMRSESDSSQWSIRMELLDGEAKFRADDDWAVNWGAGDFPTGVGVRDGANIPITAGEYIINFNSISGEYDFKLLIVYDSVGLIGTATPFGNWDEDYWMTQDPNDEDQWFIPSVALSGGDQNECKFRAEGDWAVNWGDAAFPTGTGTQDGPNILVEEGTYGITLNSATGEYAFGAELTTSIKDLLKPSDVTAYPNPASSILNIDLSNTTIRGQVELNLYDMSGALLQTESRTVNGVIQISIDDLPTGIYSLQIKGEKALVGKRVLIAR